MLMKAGKVKKKCCKSKPRCKKCPVRALAVAKEQHGTGNLVAVSGGKPDKPEVKKSHLKKKGVKKGDLKKVGLKRGDLTRADLKKKGAIKKSDLKRIADRKAA
jgi:hypothetical protein